MSSSSHNPTTGLLSQRATRAIQPALGYFGAFLRLAKRPWTHDDPDGNILVTVAENKLSTLEFSTRLAAAPPPPLAAFAYNDMRGLFELRAAWANLMHRTVLEEGAAPLDPNHLTVAAGCGALLDHLFFLLCDAPPASFVSPSSPSTPFAPRRHVLIPRPYYPAFDNDLAVRNGAVPFPFDLTIDTTRQELIDSLDAALASCRRGDENGGGDGGGDVAALLLTNPHNPLGTIYSRNDLIDIVSWCLDHNIHLISDEIYAHSVFRANASTRAWPFTSLVSILHAEFSHDNNGITVDHDRARRARLLCHTLWGLSKDFCASGLRFGCLYTQNEAINTALSNLTYFASCGGPLQCSVTHLLNDTTWVDEYLALNQSRLAHSYDTLTVALDAHCIPYQRAWAAMFCYIDLGAWATTWEEERALWTRFVDAGVLMSPGESCHAARPGTYRICFAWVPREALVHLVERIAACLGIEKKGEL